MRRSLKYVFCFLLLSCSAQAASFVSVEEFTADPRGILWNYKFTVQNGLISTTLLGTEYSCWRIRHRKDNPNPFNIPELIVQNPWQKPWDCHQNEAEARVAAQAKADAKEKEMKALGQSSTDAEIYRMKHKLF